jgi:hypothetical protein
VHGVIHSLIERFLVAHIFKVKHFLGGWFGAAGHFILLKGAIFLFACSARGGVHIRRWVADRAQVPVIVAAAQVVLKVPALPRPHSSKLYPDPFLYYGAG